MTFQRILLKCVFFQMAVCVRHLQLFQFLPLCKTRDIFVLKNEKEFTNNLFSSSLGAVIFRLYKMAVIVNS